MAQIRKLIRTVQSDLFFLKEARDALYLHGRRLLHRPHEREFYALRFIPRGLPGVFVDVGLKDSGLVHISQMANRYIKNPYEIVAVGDVVTVWVIKVEGDRRRASLTMIAR